MDDLKKARDDIGMTMIRIVAKEIAAGARALQAAGIPFPVIHNDILMAIAFGYGCTLELETLDDIDAFCQRSGENYAKALKVALVYYADAAAKREGSNAGE